MCDSVLCVFLLGRKFRDSMSIFLELRDFFCEARDLTSVILLEFRNVNPKFSDLITMDLVEFCNSVFMVTVNSRLF